MLKEWRIWVLLLSLAASLFFLGPHYATAENGDIVLETNIQKGLELEGGLKVLLGVQGDNVTEEEVNQVRDVLQTRVSAFGLTQTDIRTVRLDDQHMIQIEVADTNRTRLENLISREGSFEARMPIHIQDTREFELDQVYNFERTDSGVKVDGGTYRPGDVFYLDGDDETGTKFVYVNNTEDAANLEVVAYGGQDVQDVLRSDALVQQSGQGYSFRFPVVISEDAARNVRHVAQNYGTTVDPQSGEPYLGLDDGDFAMLRLYVDDERTSELRMAASFSREVVTQPSINGGGATAEEARADMRELQSILESGRLPAPVKIESISSISSSLGEQFTSAAFISIIAALVAVGLLVYARYRTVNVSVPIFLTGSSEVFILIGAWFSTVATLDLASIAGIIAAVGTGVDDQIIIADESSTEVVRSWKKRMKRAFFVIFTSAASTIGAMAPLVSPEISHLAIGAAGLGLIGYTFTKRTNPHYIAIGAFGVAVAVISNMMNPSSFALQAVRGFAVTTILGVMVGISITRPAYAKILEHLEE